MRFLKALGIVVRFLAEIRTGYKSVRITGFHTKSCRTHSLRFQPLEMRSIGKLHLAFNFSSSFGETFQIIKYMPILNHIKYDA